MQALMSRLNEWLQDMNTAEQILMTIVVSMVPIIELRGAIPLAAHAGLAWYWVFPAAVLGNMIPVPFIVLFIRKIFDWIKRHTRLGGMVERLEARAERKMPAVKKYRFWGLVVFVAIPLPGTGGWTGALIAALMDMRLKKAVPGILMGVVIAGIVVSILTYGIKSL